MPVSDSEDCKQAPATPIIIVTSPEVGSDIIVSEQPTIHENQASQLQLLVNTQDKEEPSLKEETIEMTDNKPITEETVSTVIANTNVEENSEAANPESKKSARERIIEQYREMEVEIKQALPGDNQALEDVKKLESQGDLTEMGGEPLTQTRVTTKTCCFCCTIS